MIRSQLFASNHLYLNILASSLYSIYCPAYHVPGIYSGGIPESHALRVIEHYFLYGRMT